MHSHRIRDILPLNTSSHHTIHPYIMYPNLSSPLARQCSRRLGREHELSSRFSLCSSANWSHMLCKNMLHDHYDNGSHVSNTLSTKTSPGIRKHTVTSRLTLSSPHAKAFQKPDLPRASQKYQSHQKRFSNAESFHNQHGSTSINAGTC